MHSTSTRPPSAKTTKLSAAARLAQREQLLRARELAQAAEALERVLKRSPGQADALHLLGALKHQAGDSDAAVT